MKTRTIAFWTLFTIWIIFLMTLTSCDPVKRHARLVERFPHVHQQDTVIFRDTIRAVIPAEKTDTVVQYQTLRDTLYIEKERVRVRIHTVHDSVYVEAECKEEIIEKEVVRKIPIVYYKDRVKNDYIRWIVIGLIFLLLLLLKRKERLN